LRPTLDRQVHRTHPILEPPETELRNRTPETRISENRELAIDMQPERAFTVGIELMESTHKMRAALDENLPGGTKAWTRGLAAASLITGAVLLASGRRKAGMIVTVAGTIAALLEDSDALRQGWEQLPAYIKQGQHMLERCESFVEELSIQGERIRKMINAQQRQHS
jgi:hypothetical protein